MSKKWYGVLASDDNITVSLTDGPFCSEKLCRRLYEERKSSSEYKQVFLVEIIDAKKPLVNGGSSVITNEFRPLFERVIALTNVDEYTEAAEILERMICRWPGSGSVHAYLAWAYLELNKFPEAFNMANKAVELSPKSALARNLLEVIKKTINE